MESTLNQLLTDTLTNIQATNTPDELLSLKNATLGKKGSLTEILKGVKDLSPEKKATVGKRSNEIKKELIQAFIDREEQIEEMHIQAQLENEFEDMTIPVEPTVGHAHPIKSDIDKVIDVFSRMGFDIHRSPDLTTEYNNFDALNIPKWHPARDMQDTFWLTDGSVLATQTSCMQNELLKTKKIPFQCIVIGPSYRNEKIDATHDIMFDQVEGFVVGKDISIGHLRHTILEMLTGIFGYEPKIRMRPGYFPFVEPGMEVDIWWEYEKDGEKKGKWLEFMGCGLIHPNVLQEGGVDPNIYSGFAFGFGLTRLTMIKYSIDDIRHIHQNKIGFLKQF